MSLLRTLQNAPISRISPMRVSLTWLLLRNAMTDDLRTTTKSSRFGVGEGRTGSKPASISPSLIYSVQRISVMNLTEQMTFNRVSSCPDFCKSGVREAKAVLRAL